MIIEGLNPVYEALSGSVTIEKLYLQKDNFNEKLNRIVGLARELNVKFSFVDTSRLDALSETKRHQGALAITTEFAYTALEDILDKKRYSPLLLVLLDGVEDPHNIGAVIRVVDSVGGDGIVIPKHRSATVTDTVVKTSAGAAAHVAVAKVTNLNDTIRLLKSRGIPVFAADMGGQSVYDTDLTGDTAIVIGGEGEGVRELTKKLSSAVISLPQLGRINSLNASVAAGALLYEAVRQRQKLVNDTALRLSQKYE